MFRLRTVVTIKEQQYYNDTISVSYVSKRTCICFLRQRIDVGNIHPRTGHEGPEGE